MSRRSISAVLVLVLVLVACGAGPEVRPSSAEPEAWRAWREARHTSLAGEDGWLTVIALVWLEVGETTLGAEPGSGCLLPADHAPARAGRVIVDEARTVRFVAEPGADVRVDGQPITSIELASDMTETPTVLEIGPIRAHLIARGDRLGLRVKDRESPARLGFTGPEVYPYDPSLRVVARFEPASTGETLPIVNVLGMIEETPVAGHLHFALGGREWSVVALFEGETLDEGLFLMLRDATSGETTYGAGRYLDVAAPAGGGSVELDFNFLETPPCGYTDHATCPLPPPENELDVPIAGGELDPHAH